MKIHVFVDDNNNVVSITPAVASSGSAQSAGSRDVVFGGARPAQQALGMKRYELDTESDLSVDLNQIEVDQLHQQVLDVIRVRPELRAIDLPH